MCGAFLAVNLAVMNLLPIPALDGGRVFTLIVTTVIEKIRRKKLNPKYEAYVHAAGMLLLLALDGGHHLQGHYCPVPVSTQEERLS